MSRKILFAVGVGFALALFTSCRSLNDGFADEDYVWENWRVSSNRIEVIDFSF